MSMEFRWLVPDRIRYHHFWDELTMVELAEGVQIFIDLNVAYSPQLIHIVVDLREVTSYSLSMVEMYGLTRQIKQVQTGYIMAMGGGNDTMQTLFSFATKIALDNFNLPYIYLSNRYACQKICKMRDTFSNDEVQQLCRLIKTSPQKIKSTLS